VITSAEIRRQSTRLPPVTLTILGLAVTVFLITYVGGDVRRTFFLDGQLRGADVVAGQWYRLVTHAFLHSSLMHVGFNMYALYLLGPSIERRAGSIAFAGLYAASALAGAAAYLWLGGPAPAVGASGAIFGLFGAWFASAWSQRHTPAGQATLRGVGFILAINLALPLFIPRIAWEAHLGGLVAGAIISYAWSRAGSDERARSAIAFGLAFVAFGLAILA
jgi:membrane associated rhomboid family serine protease